MHNEIPRFQTNLAGQRDAPATPPPIARFKVDSTASAVAPSGGTVLTCKRYDGTNTGTRIFLVAPAQTHSAGDELYAFIPAGGTKYTIAGDTSGQTRRVLWQEVGGGSDRTVTFKIWAALVGGGKYQIKINQHLSTSAIDGSANLSPADVGDFTTDPIDGIGLNLMEMNKGTHDLDPSAIGMDADQLFFAGWQMPNTNGAYVIFRGDVAEDCS